jgi:hypothetical protein
LLVDVIVAVLRELWRARLFVWTPLRKIFFPIRDARTGIKQSRMRYYRVRFTWDGGEALAYQEVDSNGNVRRYLTGTGRRFFPPKLNECTIVDGGRFQFPPWGRTDWRDIRNRNRTSGCFGIEEPE